MSFLDNLENSLKTLESQDEAASRTRDEQIRRETERQLAQASAPYADELKSGPFTAELLNEATRLGHQQRTKVHIVWLGTTLRLEARQRKLELRPTPTGIVAVFLENGAELRQQMVDLTGSAADLARDWLS